MNRLLLLPFCLLIFQLEACSQPPAKLNRNDYIEKIVRERKEKDEEMRTGEKSPIPAELRGQFSGLRYYPVKPAYKVKARFEKYDDPVHFRMKTTTERQPEYAVYGKASFRLHGKKITLNVYQNIELSKKTGYEDYLFIPFNDYTNNRKTYGGGRFIDARIPSGDTIIIDFNTAYNPYCAYSHSYSCPVPPEENKMKTKIRAGELTWDENHP